MSTRLNCLGLSYLISDITPFESAAAWPYYWPTLAAFALEPNVGCPILVIYSDDAWS